ncbi:MAG: outer membrane lipoprotein-sorting protein [Bacteroidales bacterium]|nr:outer membrane lipoprotein-sorting protein [Bacteroidales bacterium]
MNQSIKALILFSFSLLISVSLWGQDDAREIFTRATDQLLTKNMELAMEMDVKDKKGRVKEKGYEILMASFGDVDKTKMSWLKPVQAKGTTVIFTERPGETGLIEVYTPSNGKTRKLKASPDNKDRIGSEAMFTNITAQDPDELAFMFLPPQEVEGKSCYTVVVKDKDFKDQARGELQIEMDTYRIVQISVYDMYGKQTGFVKLSDFQAIDGPGKRIYPMHIIFEDLKGQKTTDMRVLKIASRTDLSEEDFKLPVEQDM